MCSAGVETIRVCVCGAAGRMGREVVKAVTAAGGMEVAAAVDVASAGEDVGMLAGIAYLGIRISVDLMETLKESEADVMVDFTLPQVTFDNIMTSLQCRVPAVVGTTGLNQAQLEEISTATEIHATPALIAPNFAIGAVLMMLFAQQAAPHFDYADIIELHHEKKRDAPSGTAVRTAQMIAAAKGGAMLSAPTEKFTLPGVRGGAHEGVHLHSVRMPGFVASQEVIFGGLGQTLTIRHDSISRESFMPGVLLAIRKVRTLKGLTIGLENIL